MAYATLSDLIDRAGEAELRQIADRDRDGLIDDDVVDAAIKDAGNLIDGYVGTKYDLPLPSVPDLVRTWAVSIARYVLHRNGAPEHVKADHDAAMAALKDVARGLVSLPVATGQTAPTAVLGPVLANHPDEVFTSDRLRGFR